MPRSLQSVLSQIPGYAGYTAAQDRNRAAETQELQQASGLMAIIGQQQERQAKQAALMEDQATKAALAESGGDATKAMQILLTRGAHGPAAKLAPILESQRKASDPRVMSPGSQLLGPDNKVLHTVPQADPPELRLLKAMEELPEGHPIKAQIGALIDTRTKAGAPPPKRDRIEGENVVQEEWRNGAWLKIGSGPRFARQVLGTNAETDRPHPVVGVDENGNQVVNFVRPSQGQTSLTTKPVGTASLGLKDENIGTRQIRGKWSTETKPERDALVTANKYENFRATGDNAQAMQAAENTLRTAMRGGSQRFKGEADKILGTGYGGGSVPERIANFLSTEMVGTPTANTIAKLDALIAASKESAIENFAERTKFYASQAKGSGWSLRKSLGDPNIFGNTVVFPDGTRAKYPNAEAAQKDAMRWVQENQ